MSINPLNLKIEVENVVHGSAVEVWGENERPKPSCLGGTYTPPTKTTTPLLSKICDRKITKYIVTLSDVKYQMCIALFVKVENKSP